MVKLIQLSIEYRYHKNNLSHMDIHICMHISVGVGAFVIGLDQISSFLSLYTLSLHVRPLIFFMLSLFRLFITYFIIFCGCLILHCLREID